MAQLILGGVGALILLLGFQTWRIDNLKEKTENYKAAIDTYVQAAEHNAAQIENCNEINAANEREAQRQRERAKEAVIRAKMLSAQLDNQIEDIDRDADDIRESVDTSCAALDEPDILDWVCSGPGGCN